MLDWLWTRGKPQSAEVAVAPWTGPRPGACVLFLDFDGVMHPAECGSFCNTPFLQRVLESCPDVDVVLSTNWRINADPEQLRSHFPSDIRSRVVDVTPVLGDGPYERQRECEGYIAEKKVGFAIALDDDASLFPPGSPLLMLVDRYVGLDAAQATALICRIAGRKVRES
jgi:hypothetical protein